MSVVLELLLDDLGKEAKEAPGWITLWRGLDKLILLARGYLAGMQECG